MTPPLAALIYPDERHDIEDLLEGVARRLQQSGRRWAGWCIARAAMPMATSACVSWICAAASSSR
jgi:hypothetical protein